MLFRALFSLFNRQRSSGPFLFKNPHLSHARCRAMQTALLFAEFRERISGLETLFVDQTTSHKVQKTENARLHGNVSAVELQVEQMQAQLAAYDSETKDLKEQVKTSEENNKRLKRRVSELENDKKTSDTMNMKLIVEMRKVVNTIGNHKVQRKSTEGERQKIVS